MVLALLLTAVAFYALGWVKGYAKGLSKEFLRHLHVERIIERSARESRIEEGGKR